MNIAIKLLTSTKFAIVIIAVIIALAAFGTVYPGGDAIFGSWLFLPFIGLLALSTVTCGLTRIRPLWRAVTHPKLDVDDQFLQQLPYLSLIHISEPTRLLSISYAVFCF